MCFVTIRTPCDAMYLLMLFGILVAGKDARMWALDSSPTTTVLWPRADGRSPRSAAACKASLSAEAHRACLAAWDNK
jgi:hypothetical protein